MNHQIKFIPILLLYSMAITDVFSQWLPISNVSVSKATTELAGPQLVIEYDLSGDMISKKMPAYVFIRVSIDGGKSWQLLANDFLRGNGMDIVSSSGHKKISWWGTGELGYDDAELLEIRMRAIQMVRVPEGEFNVKSFPAGGKDPSYTSYTHTDLPEFFISKYETSIDMYADYLNETGKKGYGWHPRMEDSLKCGIIREGKPPYYRYSVAPNKGHHPIVYVSWYDAVAFLDWCGLSLPTELMWEKAYVGGKYLDGDRSGNDQNPDPDRTYPWGNEAPDADNVFRCNFDGDTDGFVKAAPVGSFEKYDSPYGVSDLAGNVAEWTLDWYSTTYHAGLDGFRMVRGGSWMALPFACDAVSGATQFPMKESNIMGFRGVKK